MDEAGTLGSRAREVRGWRGLSLRRAAGLAGLSSSVWGQVERGDTPVGNRRTLETMAGVLRVHPSELTGQPWALRDLVSSEAHAGLIAMETALERYDLGVDPGLPVRDWPGITHDLDTLAKLMHCSADYAGREPNVPLLKEGVDGLSRLADIADGLLRRQGGCTGCGLLISWLRRRTCSTASGDTRPSCGRPNAQGTTKKPLNSADARITRIWLLPVLDDDTPGDLGRHPWHTLPPFVLGMRAAAALGYQPVGDYATTVIEEVRWLIDQYRMNPDAQLPAGLDEEFFTGSFDYTAEDFHLTAAAEPG